MPTRPNRTFASGAGTVAAPAAGVPQTGTTPGLYRGAGQAERFGQTDRRDNWWLKPVAQAVGLGVLLLYANYAAFLGQAHYHYVENGRHYLSPFYSPYIHPAWLPGWLSPALLILIFPLGFRATCYYYRKAYYRSFFADPIACAVGEPNAKSYCGELKFPFILQNLHRYFLYAAIVFLFILWWDVFQAFRLRDPATGAHSFFIGGGSLVIFVCIGLLTLYTLSCHSIRHIVGGKLDCFSCAVAGGPRQQAWNIVSVLNGHHMAWAWWSLFAVCFADFYVRACSMGLFQDPTFMTFASLFNSSPTGL